MDINLEVINLAPKFLNFYEKAKGKDVSCIWDIWKENYNFAAVPPGEQGEQMAKELLMNAWPKYPEIISYIESWSPNTERVEFYVDKVKKLLGCEQSVGIALVYYVGCFEHNAFVTPYKDGMLALCMPIEDGDVDITLVHELTHIIHSKTSDLSLNWGKSIGSLILQEGLAMQVSKHLVTGKEDEAYIEHKEGWFRACKKQTDEIIKGILPYIEDSSPESSYQFTFGTGATGNEREAYFVGWELASRLLKAGKSFKEIASIKEVDLPEIILKYLS